ncbi:GrpB protein-domain-containing protein [Neohortaea acidophila]|uniref:GrpB protein-domain-containing protein n=1 Tax=Neohortaea acidophila TaxID=245834 RepID=A0A6A6PTA4_9PEZI|nr:GrpB protein-domain-containing protein [Neohortaea acidophila]KAF2483115.1 GrpB protein-domain-containing protein [Neohortaea acidophila]
MPNETVNGVPIKSIVEKSPFDPALVQRITRREDNKKFALDVIESDPQWPVHFQTFKSRILAALEQQSPADEARKDNAPQVTVLAVNHVGSTAVPGLAAKAILDIDLILSDNTLAAEAFYVPRLEAAGFQFLFRNPQWHEQRFFRSEQPMYCHLHVFGPLCPEVERHRIFRDWLREHADDRELYASTKREASAVTIAKGEFMDEYNARKSGVLLGIYKKAFTELGYIS